MTDETRRKANRNAVAMYLREAGEALKGFFDNMAAVVEELDTDSMLTQLGLAKTTVGKAQTLARSKPPGKRALPKKIQNEIAAVIRRINQAEERIRAYAVTREEREAKRSRR